jgi:hypothetical protein
MLHMDGLNLPLTFCHRKADDVRTLSLSLSLSLLSSRNPSLQEEAAGSLKYGKKKEHRILCRSERAC